MAFIRGTRRSDRLYGTEDSDVIFSLAGDDVVFAGAGNDFMDGGAGNDTFLLTGSGLKTVLGGPGNDTLYGLGNLEQGALEPLGLTAMPGDGDDTLIVSGLLLGNLTFFGGAGNDHVFQIGWAAPDLRRDLQLDDDKIYDYSGGDGDDTFVITVLGPARPEAEPSAQFSVSGDGGDDTLDFTGVYSKLTFDGGAGSDTVRIFGQGFVPGTAVTPGTEVKVGAGDDSFLISGLFAGNLTFSGGDGDDNWTYAGPVELSDGSGGPLPAGQYSFDGGDGDDTATITGLLAGNLTFSGGAGDDATFFVIDLAYPPALRGMGSVPLGKGGSGNDLLRGSQFDDLLFGDEDNDILVGNPGNDRLIGGTGDDRAEGGEGDDILVDIDATVDIGDGVRPLEIFGDLGLRPIADIDVLLGGDDNDVLVSLIGDDRVEGGDGNDVIILGPFSRLLETIERGLPDIHVNVISSNAGAAGAGAVGSGGAGDDQFLADFGSAVFGDGGDDTIHITASGATPVRPTTVDGGRGDDSIRVEMPGPGPVSTPVPPEIAVLAGDGNDLVEIIGGGRDTPERQTVMVDGGAGDDVVDAAGYEIGTEVTGVFINGSDGNDTLTGSKGKDGFNAGPGVDTLTGGTGDDIFEFDAPGDGPDVFTDFTPGSDKFHIDLIGFGGGLPPGALPADRFIAGPDPVPVTGGGVFLYDTDNGALAWDVDGAGGSAAVTIAFLINVPALTAADFLIT